MASPRAVVWFALIALKQQSVLAALWMAIGWVAERLMWGLTEMHNPLAILPLSAFFTSIQSLPCFCSLHFYWCRFCLLKFLETKFYFSYPPYFLSLCYSEMAHGKGLTINIKCWDLPFSLGVFLWCFLYTSHNNSNVAATLLKVKVLQRFTCSSKFWTLTSV